MKLNLKPLVETTEQLNVRVPATLKKRLDQESAGSGQKGEFRDKIDLKRAGIGGFARNGAGAGRRSDQDRRAQRPERHLC